MMTEIAALINTTTMPSVLWRCWLGGRKCIRPVKTEQWVQAWLSVWSEVQTCIWPSWYHCHSVSLASVESRLVFNARCYASAVLAMALCPSVCLSLCLSVTNRSSTKTAKRKITKTTPHDSPGSLVSWRQRSPRNSTVVRPYRGAECRWGGSKSATFDK